MLPAPMSKPRWCARLEGVRGVPMQSKADLLWPIVIAAPLLAAAASAALTLALSRNAIACLRIVDHPNERSLHRTPVPRNGGLALIFGGALGMALVLPVMVPSGVMIWPALAITLLLVGGVSLLDDRRHVSQRYRLLVHACAALLLYLAGLRWDQIGLPGLDAALPDWLALGLTLLYVVWMINLYNFMDGMDGFASGMAVFGFGGLAVLGLIGQALPFAVTALVIAASAAGFLTRNFPPARIFLGDVGSSVLGLLAAALTLWGAGIGLFPLWVGWLLFSPFIIDATWTLLRRIVNGEPFWLAHRSHHYQRLVLAGWGHRRTLLRAYVVMAAAAASAVAAPDMPVQEQWLLLLGWAAIYALIHVRVGLAERLNGADRR